MKRFLMILLIGIVTFSLFASTWYSVNMEDEWGDPTGETMIAAYADMAKYTNSVVYEDDLNYAALIVYPTDDSVNCALVLSAYKYYKGAGFTSTSSLESITVTMIYEGTEYRVKCGISSKTGYVLPASESDIETFCAIVYKILTEGGTLKVKGSLAEGRNNTEYSFKAQFKFSKF